jgi:hypothetical protein
LIARELEFTHQWLVSHVSDHTCGSYRSQLVHLLLEDKRCLSSLHSKEEVSLPFKQKLYPVRILLKSDELTATTTATSNNRKIRFKEKGENTKILLKYLEHSEELIFHRPGCETI